MKRGWKCFGLISLLFLTLSACTANEIENTVRQEGLESSFVNESETQAEHTVSSLTESAAESYAETEYGNPAETETASPLPISYQSIPEKSIYYINDRLRTGLPESELHVKGNITLPDTLGLSKGKTSDKREGNQYYIAAIDLTVTIPEGYYFYRVDGMYRDSDNNPIRLSFVDEYILSLRNLSEEELVQEIYAHVDLYDSTPGKYTPYWVMWNFKIVHKDYLPAEQLFASRIKESGDIRQAGEYRVLMGTSRNWIKQGGYEEYNYRDAILTPEWMALAEEHSAGTIDEEQFNQAIFSRYDWPLRIMDDAWYTDDLKAAVCAASRGTGIWYSDVDYYDGFHRKDLLFCDDNHPTWVWTIFPDASILSGSWWLNYQYALQELEKNAEYYSYPEISLRFTRSKDQAPDTAEQLAQRKGWYQDNIADRVPRACVYAWCKATGQDIPLEDIVIYLKPSENEAKLFIAFSVDRNSGNHLTPILKGADEFSLCDLEKARTYIAEADFSETPTKIAAGKDP